MADTASTDTPTADTTPTGATGATSTDANGTSGTHPATTAADTIDYKAQADKWRALARKHEEAAKANAGAQAKLAEIEESQKTEQQKLADKLAEAEKELAGHRVSAIRVHAAREAGLDADMAQFLTATDPGDALTQAKTLAKKVLPGKPDLRQGARTAAKAPEDMNTWLRKAAGYDR